MRTGTTSDIVYSVTQFWFQCQWRVFEEHAPLVWVVGLFSGMISSDGEFKNACIKGNSTLSGALLPPPPR